MAPGDREAILTLARSLDKWFTPQGLTEVGEDLESHEGYVATRGTSFVGFLTWAPASEDIARLSWIGVEEDAQHAGIGTSLLAAAVADLRRSRFRSLEVSTVADTVDYEPYAETRRFYRSRGFVDVRVDERFFGEGDRRYDRLMLRRDLSSP